MTAAADRPRRPVTASLLALGLSIQSTWAADTAALDARHRYAQRSAPLALQLAEVAAHAQINLIYPEASLSDVPSAGLQGDFSVAAALDQLLQAHALQWRRMTDGSIRITAVQAPLRLRVGTVDVRDSPLDPRRSGASSSPDRRTLPGMDLLAQRTAAGWSIDQTALRVLPGNDLARWLNRSPNVYGQGSKLSLRGIERDSFAAQTSAVRLHGLPLSARALDAGLPLPPQLALIDFALGPQPSRIGQPGFAGELNLDAAAPVPWTRGGLRTTAGGRGERQVDLHQSADLRAAGAAQLVWLRREREGTVRHVDGLPQSTDQLATLRWALEPEAWPALTVFADLLWVDAQPADERISVPLNVTTFDPALRTDLAVTRDTSLGEHGGRLGARWLGSHWEFDSIHLLQDSAEAVRGPNPAGNPSLIENQEWARAHQFAASRSLNGPVRLRMSLDHSERRARFINSDDLPLAALFPVGGPFTASPDSFRRLRTGVEQRISSTGGQVWLQAQWRVLELEAGTGWAQQERREISTVQRLLSPNCMLTARNGSRLDCSEELPDLLRSSEQRSREPQLTPATTVLYRSEVAGQFGVQWRRGLRSGGTRPSGGQTQAFKPERSDSFELSWRSPDWSGLSARVALFRNLWRDRQVQLLDPGQPGFAIVNAGRARASGGELTLQHRFTDHWALALGLGALSTRYERFQLAAAGAPLDLSGRRFPGAPSRTATLSLSRAPEHGLEFGLIMQAAARAEGDPYNRVQAQLAGRAELDLRLGWRTQRFGLGVEVLNVADRDAFERIGLSLLGETPRTYELGAPRQVRLTGEWRW